ncbi:hypothetical protein OFC56_39305, partial [Escherichia coli]|nr:hypothetical protein [Escherichia coli]
VAAITIAIIAVFIYEPLQFIPIASLGVVLIIASLSLLDLKSIWILKTRDKDAFYLAIITFISVLVIDGSVTVGPNAVQG